MKIKERPDCYDFSEKRHRKKYVFEYYCSKEAKYSTDIILFNRNIF